MRVAKIPDAFFEPFYLNLPLKTLPVLPADLLSVLGTGMVQAAPVPALAFLEAREALRPLPFCLSREEGFALIIGEKLGEEVELGLSRFAAGSVAYAQVLLKAALGVKGLWLIPDARPGETAVYLAEGEEAVRLSREAPVVLDVAREWTRWSGRRPVFYIWAVPKSLEEESVRAIEEALDMSLQGFASEPASWRAQRVGLDPQDILAGTVYRVGRLEEMSLSFLNQVKSLISET